MMDPELERVASQVAARYRRRCWWADLDDLEQTARLACWEATRTWDPDHGAPLAAYAWRAAVLAVRRYLWRASAPVSASDHYLPELAGKFRAPVDVFGFVHTGDDGAPTRKRELTDPQPWPDKVVASHRWHAAVRDHIEALLQYDVERGKLHIDEALAALRVALDEEQPSHVAADSGLEVAQVYKARRRLSLLVLHSLRCYELAKEPP